MEGVCGHLTLSFALTKAMVGRVSIVANVDDEPVRMKPTSADCQMTLAVTKTASHKVSLQIFERARGLASTTIDVRSLLLGFSHSLQQSLRVFEEKLEVDATYEPDGEVPRRGSLVRLQPFATRGVLSRGDMVVDDDRVTSMPVLAWTERVETDLGTFESWKCSARVHRNQIYVVDNDQDTWTGRLMSPITGIAGRALETAKPAVNLASRLSFTSIRTLGAVAHSAVVAAAAARE